MALPSIRGPLPAAIRIATLQDLPRLAQACAGGCGVFSVSTNSMLPGTIGNDA